MKTIIHLAIIIGFFSAVELYFGTHDTGAKVALIMLVWCCASIPLGLVIGRIFEIEALEKREY